MLDFIVALFLDVSINLVGRVAIDAIGHRFLLGHSATHELPAPTRRHPSRRVAHLHRVAERHRATRRLPASTTLEARVAERSRRPLRPRVVNRRRPGGRRA
ncbi:hypothetical protein [Kitasatospora sp. NPDC015120]|uniref:hypothetical protein n=1 Tax=Kitasatospora sp. NPDC015120 TaxID=3364023 RepID=UPI0036F49B56